MFVSGEFQITKITKTNYTEVYRDEDADNCISWYKCKVSYLDIDPESGKEQKVTKVMAVTANTIKGAVNAIDECLSGMLVDCEVEAIAKTNIVEVFPYVPESKKEQESSPFAVLEEAVNE